MSDEDRAFFLQMATCREPYRRLADCIHETLSPSLVLDLGAGLGFVARRLLDLGWTAFASDLHAPYDLRMPPDGMWVPGVDLAVPSGGALPFTVAICTETAEHIDERYANVVVANVARCATSYIVWSAAQPGQEWPGRVNLQPPGYWLAKFAALGWAPDVARTERLRTLMLERHAQHEYAASNFFILTSA